MSRCTQCGKLHILKRPLCDGCYIAELEAENILLKKQVERIINEVDRLSGITHEHSVWFAHGMKLVLKHIRAAIVGEQRCDGLKTS